MRRKADKKSTEFQKKLVSVVYSLFLDSKRLGCIGRRQDDRDQNQREGVRISHQDRSKTT